MSITDEIEKLIQPSLAENGFEVLEVQYRREAGQWILRIFIDHLVPALVSSVTLDDCEKVSQLADGLIEGSALISGSYQLEVSSPGINRSLKKEAHFLRFIGQKIKVNLYAPLSELSKQKNFSGGLLNCQDQVIEIDDVISGKVKIPLSAIAKAHLNLI